MTRTAGDIGAGLAQVRPARSIRTAERIHVIGAAGAGASAAALLADAAGAIVSGCDSGGPSPYVPPLEAAAIPLEWRHDPAHVTSLPAPDRVAVTKALTSIAPDHPELLAARALGIPLQPWQQVIADAAVGRRLVALAGTHGKSTTAGWLTHILVGAGRDPSAFVGALLPPSLTGGLPATARVGGGGEFIVEADEYAGNFDAYRPDVVGITNVDWDHPDVFPDRRAVVDAFAAWLGAVPEAIVVVNLGDPGAAELAGRLGGRRGLVCGYAVGGPAKQLRGAVGDGAIATSWRATPDGTRISMSLSGDRNVVADIRLAGSHSVANAVLVAEVASRLGVPLDPIQAGLETFDGVGRRLERKGEAAGVTIYDDYGHHPTAIRATIDAVRQREPGRRLWIACEPLTFHRTAALLAELAAALAGADGVAVADIWPGRDPDRTIASSAGLATATAALAPGRPVEAPGDVDATARWLADRVSPGDVVLVMGGGHSYQIADRLLERLGGREAAPGVH